MEAKSPEQNLLELNNELVKIVNRCEILIKERCYKEHKQKFILMLSTLLSKVYQVSSFEELKDLCDVLWKLMEWIKKSTENRIIQVPEDRYIQELLRETAEQNENIEIVEEEKIYYGIIERIAHNDPLFSLFIMYLTCLIISSDYYFVKIPAGILGWIEGIQSTKNMIKGFINNQFIKNEVNDLSKLIEEIMKKSSIEVNRNIDKNKLYQYRAEYLLNEFQITLLQKVNELRDEVFQIMGGGNVLQILENLSNKIRNGDNNFTNLEKWYINFHAIINFLSRNGFIFEKFCVPCTIRALSILNSAVDINIERLQQSVQSNNENVEKQRLNDEFLDNGNESENIPRQEKDKDLLDLFS